ncbi:hypothetical protein ABTX35_00745 [Streptomyces sp. NPDC096080]|uniref:hypothetical protein n=1 Tax=Streptomyces sp. NPDC096080 TaxID=3156693 RepID=UPI00333175C9
MSTPPARAEADPPAAQPSDPGVVIAALHIVYPSGLPDSTGGLLAALRALSAGRRRSLGPPQPSGGAP